MQQKQKIGIAMSGGVDSTTVALTLRDSFDVHGFFMKLAQPDFQQQQEKVRRLAERLDIPLTTIDLEEKFKQVVLEYFTSTYFRGETPNPCVICNHTIKFGVFLEAVLNHGMTKMATGHYATIVEKNTIYHLHCGQDDRKDQSYFLSRLTQAQLANVLFPLGRMRKTETYRIAAESGFTEFASGGESQDVCFLADTTVADFLRSRQSSPPQPGPVVTRSGQQLGTHEGLHKYTIGQRRGLGIAYTEPLYVIDLDTASNHVIVGGNDELFKKRIHVDDLHWLAGRPPALDRTYLVRIRYTHRGAAARLTLGPDDSGRLDFSEPQRAITPGQFAVFYDGDELLGSGLISKQQQP